ncbi:MAG TPA: DUF2141 domain-containing protein, partial [Brevundimonas sp.]
AAAVIALVAAPALAQTGEATITLTFDTAASTGGVMVALYGSEDAYGHGAAITNTMVNIAAGQHTATFTVPAGDYAVKAFHDVDGDGKMNTNPFGMPTEPYAFSNNARGNMGPATWSQTHFTASGVTARTISLR